MTFFTGTAYLIGFSAYFTWQFLKQDGVNRQPLTLAKGLWKMFGYRGVVSAAIPAWFAMKSRWVVSLKQLCSSSWSCVS